MPPYLFSVQETNSNAQVARSLSLAEAFARVMALSGREQWIFTRTGRVMHLVILPLVPDDPPFESAITSNGPARKDIMAQVVAWGFQGRFRVTPENEFSDPAPRENAA